jgi:hypothetical protein
MILAKINNKIKDFFSGKNFFENKDLQDLYDSFYKDLTADEKSIFDSAKNFRFHFDYITKIEANTPNMSNEEEQENNIKIMKLNKSVGLLQEVVRGAFLKGSHKVDFWTNINKDLDKVIQSHSLNTKIKILEDVLIHILTNRKNIILKRENAA